jgi:two-component system chemotaxis response regulator CheY
MRILIVEDDFGSRRMLQTILNPYGECDIAVDGKEAVEAFKIAYEEKHPYSLICLDIMMPNMDGREALKEIRGIEDKKGIVGSEKAKVIMITALDDPKSIIGSFKDQCEAYMVKPIDKEKLLSKVSEFGLIIS